MWKLIFFIIIADAHKLLKKKIQCPRCGKYGMHSSGIFNYFNRKQSSVWKCPYCYQKFTTIKKKLLILTASKS